MNKLVKVVLVVLVSVLIGLILTGCSTQGAEQDNLAPDFLLYNLEGKPVSLSDFHGKPVIVNFWATWCGPCVYEMPFLQQVYEEWSTEELVLLIVNIGESPSQVEGFIEKYELSLPVLLDTKQEVARKYHGEGYNESAHGHFSKQANVYNWYR